MKVTTLCRDSQVNCTLKKKKQNEKTNGHSERDPIEVEKTVFVKAKVKVTK